MAALPARPRGRFFDMGAHWFRRGQVRPKLQVVAPLAT